MYVMPSRSIDCGMIHTYMLLFLLSYNVMALMWYHTYCVLIGRVRHRQCVRGTERDQGEEDLSKATALQGAAGESVQQVRVGHQ